MKPGTHILLLLAAFLLGSVSAYFLVPAKVKIQEKIVYTKSIATDKSKATTTTTTKKPDGTTVVTERVEVNDKVSLIDKAEYEKLKAVEKDQVKFGINGLVLLDPLRLGTFSYGIQLEYRAFGPVWVSVGGFSDLTIYTGVGFKW